MERTRRRLERLVPAHSGGSRHASSTKLDSAAGLNELRVPPANNLEKLKGDREGEYSIRINEQFRVWFMWTTSGPVEVGTGSV